MDNDFIPFKDIFLFVFVLFTNIWILILEKIFTIFGKILTIWKVTGLDLLVKTADTGNAAIKSRADLIKHLY